MTKAVGIICEYNPFHNGHLYHLNRVKEIFNDYTVILVLNGYFTQRGLISTMTKEDKVKVALDFGIDLVIELPFIFGTQAADIFAKGAIQILNALNVESIVFGSELDNVKELTDIVDVQNTPEYNKIIQEKLDTGISYPVATAAATKLLTGKTIDTPNDLLGISYIKCIKELNSSIKPYTIKRTNDYHSLNTNSKIISGSSIRNLLKNKENISNYIPFDINKYHVNYWNLNAYFDIIKYKIITEQKNLTKYQTVDEGLECRLIKYIDTCNSIEELTEKVKSKRYTYNRIQRMFVHILCSLTKEEAKNNNIEYIRILGFNNNGKNYLNKIKKTIDIPIISKLSNQHFNHIEIENRVTNIFNIIQSKKINEYKVFPIYKQD